MRLRGRIDEIPHVHLLSRTINTISRQTNELVLRFTKTHMYLISTTDEGTDDIRIWSEMPTDHLFASYAMEGTSPENDEIYLKLSADLFASALKIHQHAKSLKLKLTQKPSIYFFIEKTNFGRNTIEFKHEVSVQIISRKFWNIYEELEIPSTDVIFEIPRSWYFKTHLDKLKGFAKSVELKVDGCDLKLKACNLNSEIETICSNVKIKDCFSEDGQAAVNVDIKRLSKFFNSISIGDNDSMEAKILTNQLLHLSFECNRMFVHFALSHRID